MKKKDAITPENAPILWPINDALGFIIVGVITLNINNINTKKLKLCSAIISHAKSPNKIPENPILHVILGNNKVIIKSKILEIKSIVNNNIIYCPEPINISTSDKT